VLAVPRSMAIESVTNFLSEEILNINTDRFFDYIPLMKGTTIKIFADFDRESRENRNIIKHRA
jgi:hypothetical protein